MNKCIDESIRNNQIQCVLCNILILSWTIELKSLIQTSRYFFVENKLQENRLKVNIKNNVNAKIEVKKTDILTRTIDDDLKVSKDSLLLSHIRDTILFSSVKSTRNENNFHLDLNENENDKLFEEYYGFKEKILSIIVPGNFKIESLMLPYVDVVNIPQDDNISQLFLLFFTFFTISTLVSMAVLFIVNAKIQKSLGKLKYILNLR